MSGGGLSDPVQKKKRAEPADPKGFSRGSRALNINQEKGLIRGRGAKTGVFGVCAGPKG